MLEKLDKGQLIQIIAGLAWKAMNVSGSDEMTLLLKDESRDDKRIGVEFMPDRILFTMEKEEPPMSAAAEKAFAEFVELMNFIFETEKAGIAGKLSGEEAMSHMLMKTLVAPLFAGVKCSECGGSISMWTDPQSCTSCKKTFSLKDIFLMAEAAFDSRS